jgi:hypothetical protein
MLSRVLGAIANLYEGLFESWLKSSQVIVSAHCLSGIDSVDETRLNFIHRLE